MLGFQKSLVPSCIPVFDQAPHQECVEGSMLLLITVLIHVGKSGFTSLLFTYVWGSGTRRALRSTSFRLQSHTLAMTI